MAQTDASPRSDSGPPRPGNSDWARPLDPMLARLGPLPEDTAAWAYEIKWDGVRAIVHVDRQGLTVHSRLRNEITAQYPELWSLPEHLSASSLVLDGEIVAMDELGRPSFQLLQSRLGLKSPTTIRLRAQAVPATLLLFDVLEIDGRDVTALPYTERRSLLAELALEGPGWQTPPHAVGDPEPLLQVTRERDLEGIVAKRLDSPYLAGKRPGSWLKIKHQRRQELVIGGYTLGAGSRTGSIGALLLGYYDAEGPKGRLTYAGSVGTGFNRAMLDHLRTLFVPLETTDDPFEVNSPGAVKIGGKWRAISARGGAQSADQPVTFLRPELVCEIEFTEWTRDGTLRHPSFKGLRDDKDPRMVIREPS